jgi:hypothetical protein
MTITLSEAQELFDWTAFCDKFGYSVWAVNEGGGDVQVEICVEDFKSLYQ